MNKFDWYYDDFALKMLGTYILIPNVSLKFMLIYGEPNDSFNDDDDIDNLDDSDDSDDRNYQETVIGWRLQLNIEHWQSVIALKFIHLKPGYNYDD